MNSLSKDIVSILLEQAILPLLLTAATSVQLSINSASALITFVLTKMSTKQMKM